MLLTKNTLQSTNNWVKVWKSWTAQKGYNESKENYEPEVLNKILEQFYATVRKKDVTIFKEFLSRRPSLIG